MDAKVQIPKNRMRMMEFWKKIDRLVSEELKVMYVGGCRLYGKKNECSRIPVSVKRWKIEAFRWLEAPIENEKIRRI